MAMTNSASDLQLKMNGCGCDSDDFGWVNVNATQLTLVPEYGLKNDVHAVTTADSLKLCKIANWDTS